MCLIGLSLPVLLSDRYVISYNCLVCLIGLSLAVSLSDCHVISYNCSMCLISLSLTVLLSNRRVISYNCLVCLISRLSCLSLLNKTCFVFSAEINLTCVILVLILIPILKFNELIVHRHCQRDYNYVIIQALQMLDLQLI